MDAKESYTNCKTHCDSPVRPGTSPAYGIDQYVNLAPYSFFNAFNYIPAIIGFSSIGYKDTVRNVQETVEFVCNLVTADYFTIGPEQLIKLGRPEMIER